MIKVTLNKVGKALMTRFDYDPDLIETIKTTGSANWNDKKKYWLLRPTESGLTFLNDQEFEVTDKRTEDKLCEWFEKLIIKQKNRPARWNLAHATSAPVIKDVLDQCHFVDADGNPCQPRPAQWVPAHYFRLNGGNMLLLDDMALGKTAASVMITLLHEYKNVPVLIVCPPSLTGNWENELQKMFHLSSKIINTPLTKLDPNIRFYIVSYYQMHKVQIKSSWFLIVDEFHNFKNRQTVRYKELEKMLLAKKHLIGLTGTPVPNRPKELYSGMSAVEPGFYNWFDFGLAFCDAKYNGFGWDMNGASNLDILHKWLYEDFAVRRTKDVVLSQLPPKIRQVISMQPDTRIKANSVLEMFAESARQKIKVKEFWECLDDVLLSLNKVIVFAHHKDMLDAISAHCTTLGLKAIRIDGSVPGEKRFGLVQQFQNDPDTNVAVLSILAASEGLNMQKAQAVVFTELYWVAAKILQAEDRAHRPGVAHNVLCLYLLWGRVDHSTHKLVLQKQGISERILAGKHLDVSDEDMIRILSKEWGVPVGAFKK